MEDLIMKKLISCEFNFDTVCVELKFSDGSMIAIDTIAVTSNTILRIWRHQQRWAEERTSRW